MKTRDSIKNTTRSDLSKILTHNGSKIVKDHEELIDRCADFLTFGAIDGCKKCNSGELILAKGGYVCNGNIDDWTTCNFFTPKPVRHPCQIPSGLKKASQTFFLSYKPVVKDRILRPREEKETFERQEVGTARTFTVQRKKEPLYGMHVVPIGRLEMNRPEMKVCIEKMGGRLVTKLNEKIAVVISKESEVEKMSKRMEEVKAFNIQVVPENFLSSIDNGTREEAIEKIKSMAISDWGSDPLSRIPADEELKPIVKVNLKILTTFMLILNSNYLDYV